MAKLTKKEFSFRIKEGMKNNNAGFKISKAMQGDNNPSKRPEERIKNSKRIKKIWKNKIYRKKQTKSHILNSKLTWKNPDIRKNRIRGMKESYCGKVGEIRKKKRSKIGKELWKKNKNDWVHIINSLNSKESVNKRTITLSNRYKNDIDFLNDFKLKFKASGAIEKIKEWRKHQIPCYTSSIEVKIQNYLKELGITFFTHQYINIKHGYQCDILIPSINLIIECDGDYWHSYPIGKDIDHIRTKELIEKGFKVLRLWEFEINKMSIKDFKNKLDKIYNGTKSY